MRECQHNQVTALTTPITRPQVKSVATINDEQVHNSQEDDWIKSQINTNYKVSLNLLRHNTWQNRSNARVSLVWPSPRLVKTKRLRRPRQVQTGPSSTVQYSACTPVLGGMPGSGQVSTGGLQQVVWQLGKTLLYQASRCKRGKWVAVTMHCNAGPILLSHGRGPQAWQNFT